ncbi:MAG TPA: DinB family protein [Chitinophagaceae bacterium]|jgi:uncharacterized damage-inducible protein DinB|nr:DinB family protein [Chitinophagaceae bacterium]
MNNEMQAIANSMQDVFTGAPWYGKPVLEILNTVNQQKVYENQGDQSHSMIELLYHMITWVEFTLHRLEKNQNYDAEVIESFDWRQIDQEQHTWNNGVGEITAMTNKIINLLQNSPDSLLDEKVDFRDYNFRVLLNGLIQHNIYHIGQIAFLNKSLS